MPSIETKTRCDPCRIIILCDGTWGNRNTIHQILHSSKKTGDITSTAKFSSNVALLAQCVITTCESSQHDAQGGKTALRQTVFYQDGIGTSPGVFEQLYNGATGDTINHKVEKAYRFLVDNYGPGDQICIFGFSRGAYTARSLAGFINYAGIMSKVETGKSLIKIWNAYQARDPHRPKTIDFAERTFYEQVGRWPSGNAMRSARRNTEQSIEKRDDDEESQSAAAVEEESHEREEGELANRWPRVYPPTIEVVGVWDTVGALGMPEFGYIAPTQIRFYSFFDPILAPNVRYAFHALSLNEDRKDFLPTLWHVPHPGAEVASDRKRRQGQVLKQVWFQGSHADIGGGHDFHGLSDVTLAWMVAQLTDVPEGHDPLVSIDVNQVKLLQDHRRAWAKQHSHPSRPSLLTQATRDVAMWSMIEHARQKKKGKESDTCMLTHEAIHYSVIKGDQLHLERSPQFRLALEHRPDVIRAMWSDAHDPSTLLPTEKHLMWTPLPEPVHAIVSLDVSITKDEQQDKHESADTAATSATAPTGAHTTTKSMGESASKPLMRERRSKNPQMPSNVEDAPLEGTSHAVSSTEKSLPVPKKDLNGRRNNEDPDLPPIRPRWVPKPLWRCIEVAGWLPPKSRAFVVNLGPRPSGNLKPGLALVAFGKIDRAIMNHGKKQKQKNA